MAKVEADPSSFYDKRIVTLRKPNTPSGSSQSQNLTFVSYYPTEIFQPAGPMPVSFSLTKKVILFIAIAIVFTTVAVYTAVAFKLSSELDARQRSEGEQHLRTLALVLAQHVAGIKLNLDGMVVKKVITPRLSDLADDNIVDESVSYVGGNATIFSYERTTGQFIRRATTVKKENGERATGTLLSPDSPAQTFVRAGHAFYGRLKLFGQHFYTIYQPTFDETGQLSGILYVGIPIELYDVAQRQTLDVLALAACIIALVSCAIIGALASHIFRPLTVLSSRIEALAAGELDAPINAKSRRDEVGALTRAVEALRLASLKARTLELEKNENAADALKRRAELDGAIARFRTGVSEHVRGLAVNTTRLRARAEKMAVVSEDAKQAVTVADRNSQESSSRMRNVSRAAESLSTSIQDIGIRLEQAKVLASTASKNAEEVDKQMGALTESAGRIGDVVSLIRSIANQTNLLALNATIEAARAGQAGRGFAAVASEVKALADQTAKATEDVATQIGHVQMLTSSAVEAIRAMTDRMHAIDRTTGGIADTMVDQGEATSEIYRNVANAAQGSNEIAQSLSVVTGAASTTTKTASSVSRAAGDVDGVVAALKNEIESFLGCVAS